jgi:hypothetical protein
MNISFRFRRLRPGEAFRKRDAPKVVRTGERDNTPTHASWLNQIEIWFSILTRQALK